MAHSKVIGLFVSYRVTRRQWRPGILWHFIAEQTCTQVVTATLRPHVPESYQRAALDEISDDALCAD
jgi:hypothetical protein